MGATSLVHIRRMASWRRIYPSSNGNTPHKGSLSNYASRDRRFHDRSVKFDFFERSAALANLTGMTSNCSLWSREQR